jgi:hemerythrin-like domain-containing protein
MTPSSIQVIRDEHVALASMLKSLLKLVEQGPGDEPERFFDVARATLFYVDEFPERLHHPKETQLLFPRLAKLVPEVMEDIVRLEQDHAQSEAGIRELQHLLLAWELVGDSRRARFEAATRVYVEQYLQHMRLEDSVILPAAMKSFGPEDWKELDAAFATNCDPLTGKYPRDPMYDRLFTRIVRKTPNH